MCDRSLGEFETVMQTRDEFEGLHNCREFFQPSSVYIALCKHGEKVSYCFYKMTSSKNYNARKDKKFISLIKTHLPTTLIWHWHFKTMWWSAMWRVYNSFWFQMFIKAQIEIWEIFVHFLISVSKIWQRRVYPWKYSNSPRNAKIFTSHNAVCILSSMQARLSANQSARTILVIL